MTPPAATRAGRAAAATAPGQPPSRQATRAPQRRVSRGAQIPRRVSGPATGRARPVSPRVAPRRPAQRQPLLPRLALSAVAAIRGLPDHRWLDRLVRGRAWIPVLGVLLAGIVATQVEVLKLGASTGRWIDRTAALSSQNQALQASVAKLSDDQRIERLARQMGMVMPAPTAITFLHRPGRNGARVAVRKMRPPDPAQFQATLPSSSATVGG